MENGQWQGNKTTTPPKVTQLELPLRHNNALTDGEIAEMQMSLTGLMLTLLSCTEQFVRSLEVIAQSNSATPKMVEAWLFVLSEMVSRITSISDQLKTLPPISKVSSLTSQSEEYKHAIIDATAAYIQEIVNRFDL